VSGATLLASAVALSLWPLGRWLPKEKRAGFARLLRSREREDKWTHVLLRGLLLGLSSVVGEKDGPKASARRVLVTAFLVLAMVLSLTGVISKSVFGFSMTPWQAYDDGIALAEKLVQRPKDGTDEVDSSIHRLVEEGKAPYWKYVYTATAGMLTVLVYVACFWGSSLVTRHAIYELDGARSWMMKISIVYLFASVFLLAFFLSVILFSLTSFLVWAAMMSADILGDSFIYVVVAALAGALFQIYVSDPWLKAFVFAAMLPFVAFMALVIPSLATDLSEAVYTRIRRSAVSAACRQLGDATVPLFLMLAVVVFVGWSMTQLLQSEKSEP
jgi:hypothetical protein